MKSEFRSHSLRTLHAPVRFNGTVSVDNATHFFGFPGHQQVFDRFEKRVERHLKPQTHLDLTNNTYTTSQGLRQEHFVTVMHRNQLLKDKTYIGAWGADENRGHLGWDAIAMIPGLGQWAQNKKDEAWYAQQLDKAFSIAKNAETQLKANDFRRTLATA